MTANNFNNINMKLLLTETGNKTLCDICNTKAARKSGKKKDKPPEDEEAEPDGTSIPVENYKTIFGVCSLVFVSVLYPATRHVACLKNLRYRIFKYRLLFTLLA